MLAFRPIVLLFALIVLSSCAYTPDNPVFSRGRCATGAAEHLQGVDWEKAKKLDLRIRQGDFLPVYMGLLQNQSYVLAIENADDVSHTFRAMEFFRAVAVAGVRVDGGEFEQVDCLNGVSIPPGKVTEIRLVAVRDGSYEFEDNGLMFSLAMIGSAGGFITIESPRERPESPLEYLKLFERKPIELTPEDTGPTGLFDDEEEEPAPAPGGLFDDEEQPPDEPPGGLFDDEEQPPDEPPSGLFDDQEPEQPIEGSPSIPVEPAPGPGESLFGEPSLEPLPEVPEAPLVDTPPDDALPDTPQTEPSEGLFGEPSLEPLPEMPEAPLVDAPPQIPAEMTAPEPPDGESDMMIEEAPVVEGAPEPFDEEEELFVEEVPAADGPIETPDDAPPPQSQPPVAMPPDYEPLDGPPADIFSDPPDVVKSAPGSGGAAGEDRFDGSG